jgi:hypothetical protein
MDVLVSWDDQGCLGIKKNLLWHVEGTFSYNYVHKLLAIHAYAKSIINSRFLAGSNDHEYGSK